MRKLYPHSLMAVLILTVALSGCGRENDNNGPSPSPNPSPTPPPPISIAMSRVPGATIFPIGAIYFTGANDYDSRTCTMVDYPYYIAQTEVTYQQWSTVYAWATDAARGANRYYFQNDGEMGDTDQHPVTWVSWRDVGVWCNALTEYYNSEHGTGWACAFISNGAVIRDSRNSNVTALTMAYFDLTAKGFRLPTGFEWELAARWRTDSTNTVTGYTNPYFTKGNSASGAAADYSNAAATQDVAWYSANSGSSTHPVGLKTANSLGIKDMSGNVWEWCEGWFPGSEGYRWLRGGSLNSNADYLQIDARLANARDYTSGSVGFRPARTE